MMQCQELVFNLRLRDAFITVCGLFLRHIWELKNEQSEYGLWFLHRRQNLSLPRQEGLGNFEYCTYYGSDGMVWDEANCCERGMQHY